MQVCIIIRKYSKTLRQKCTVNLQRKLPQIKNHKLRAKTEYSPNHRNAEWIDSINEKKEWQKYKNVPNADISNCNLYFQKRKFKKSS